MLGNLGDRAAASLGYAHYTPLIMMEDAYIEEIGSAGISSTH